MAATVTGALATVLGGLIVGHAVGRGATRFNDYRGHVEIAAVAIQTSEYPGNFLVYWLDALLAGFSTERQRLLIALVVLTAVAIGAKVAISVRYLEAEWRRTGPVSRPGWWAAAAALLCATAFALPTATRYLGQLPPNVWHNSTTIILMPLAVGLFWSSLAYLRSPRPLLIAAMVALVALNVATKPSFVFCFLVAFPLAALLRFGFSRPAVGAWLVTVVAAACVGVQYLYIYVIHTSDPRYPDEPASSVAFDPFGVWSAFSANIPLSLLASYLFPAVAIAAGGRAIRDNLAVRYALGLAAAGLLWFILVKESGPHEPAGNFTWQAVVANYLLFLALAAAILPWLRGSRLGFRQVAVLIAFALHVGAGVRYLHHWWMTGAFG